MMTVEFIAQSMAEAIRAISDLRAELEIAYEHLHAAEAERDALKAERADIIKINNGWAHEWDKMREERDALRAGLDRIVSAYDAYRGKGMLPAPNQYAMLVAAIDAAREKSCDCVRPEIHGHQLLCKHGKAR